MTVVGTFKLIFSHFVNVEIIIVFKCEIKVVQLQYRVSTTLSAFTIESSGASVTNWRLPSRTWFLRRQL